MATANWSSPPCRGNGPKPARLARIADENTAENTADFPLGCAPERRHRSTTRQVDRGQRVVIRIFSRSRVRSSERW